MKLNSATLSNAPFADNGRPVADRSGSVRRPGRGVLTALAILRIYKLVLSPLFAGSCRFAPSCADYAADAVRLHGVPRGSWLALKRLGRCHPFCAGGHDPVPPQF